MLCTLQNLLNYLFVFYYGKPIFSICARVLEISSRAYVLENGRIILDGVGKQLMTEELVRKVYLGL